MNEHSESKDDKTAGGHAPIMSSIELAHLGDGQVAYIKILPSEKAREMFPAIEDLPDGINLYALHGADGTPMMLTDSRSAAIANAIENDLEPVSVH